MFYLNPKLQPQFESLSVELKDEIRSMDIRVESMSDLMSCLERIIEQENKHNA
jgi:hypothetical protein